jgi:hypothetical protein
VKHINWEIKIDKEIISKIMEKNKDFFSNSGRDIVNFISKCKMAHARRVIALDKEHKFILTVEDLEKGLIMVQKTKKIVKINSPPFGMYM